jgi:P27 family predicted phage terminase small subunit
MPAGRPPKPIEQHIKEGTYRKDRHEGALVITTPGHGIAHLGAPAHLTPLQQEVWLEIARLLESIVRESDVPMVEMSAVAYAGYREAQKLIDHDGLVYVDTNDNLKEHPAVRVAQRYMKQFMDTSARLGLSPADRARLGINLGNLKKTKTQLMEEQYGEGEGEGEEIQGEVIPDVGQEPAVLTDGELGYDVPES